ncbi:hypothetical protein [Hydrogenophaga sp.]|uniref:hypothetical protein n=1 Tax=Hydrogenophaga sp. TaxID=1904254 RepID=UPI0027368705|nr:hypothetical protein [Hydrogenophaga sp.]MDP3106959.1 hypothetical protein [Hydrogenophaga sp.]
MIETAHVGTAGPACTIEGGCVANGFERRSESITYTYPEAHSLRTSRPFMNYPPEFRRPSLARVAHHEAAHVILLRWIGLDSPKATATATSGLAYMPSLPDVPEQHPDPTGEVAACAAAIFHAGAMGELLHEGIEWTGPLFYPEQVDYQMANRMLMAGFGNHASSGHAWAQRVALHVLQSRWDEVQGIARVLIERGEWTAGFHRT